MDRKRALKLIIGVKMASDEDVLGSLHSQSNLLLETFNQYPVPCMSSVVGRILQSSEQDF